MPFSWASRSWDRGLILVAAHAEPRVGSWLGENQAAPRGPRPPEHAGRRSLARAGAAAAINDQTPRRYLRVGRPRSPGFFVICGTGPGFRKCRVTGRGLSVV